AADDAGVPLAPQLKPNARGSGGGSRRRKKGGGTSKLGAHDDEEDEFSEQENGSGDDKDLTRIYSLQLDKEGKKLVKVKAPANVTKGELDRIQKWLSYQLIVE